jgi:gamma-glutamylcyclotransferase (GGCT)/AIG2-like uncharacterized protein YtfP
MDGFEFIGEAVAPGRLLDCGSFPGLIQGEENERVHGEIYQVRSGYDVEDLLTRVDGIERFIVFGRNNFYERRIITARDTTGKATVCWAYHWMGKEELPVVKDGVWGV